MSKGKIVFAVVGVIVLIAVGVQLVPYGRMHVNPPVRSEPQWDSPRTRELFRRACAECHSNETVWPWYSNIAPASWLIYNDVAEGRGKFNFSDWGNDPGELDEMIEQIDRGGMPPIQYWIFHPGSRLSPAQKETFIKGL
jgi:mono/diheme cytochrome c family protein